MKKILSPDINLYSEILPYLQDFYTLNKEKNKNFSYRYLALRLKWSAPYINDLIKGRKKLSLKRALEFIELLELKGTNAERFLFLFLSDSDNLFSNSLLNKNALAAHDSKKQVHKEVLINEFEKFETMFDLYILFYLDYFKGEWNAEKFLLKFNFPKKPSIDFLNARVIRMVENKLLKPLPNPHTYQIISLGGVVLDQHDGASSEEEHRKLAAITKQERDYAESYLNYLNGPMKQNIFCSGIINLNTELYSEAKDRLFAFRNFLYELDQRAQADIATATSADSRIWQFSMHIFSIFEDDTKKI